MGRKERMDIRVSSVGVGFSMLLGILISFHVWASAVLTEKELQKIIQEIENAARRQDIQGILQHISPEVRIVAKKRRNDGIKTITMDYESYRASLKNRWNGIEKYIYRVEKWDVKISANQKEATVSGIIYERYDMKG